MSGEKLTKVCSSGGMFVTVPLRPANVASTSPEKTLISSISVLNSEGSEVEMEIYNEHIEHTRISVSLKFYRWCRDIVNEGVVPHHHPGVIEEVHQLLADRKPVGS